VVGYRTPKSRTEYGSCSLNFALANPDRFAMVINRVRREFELANLVCSELWLRHVYGYFRNMYAPESGTRDTSQAILDTTHSLPADRHLAVLCVREHFPDHEPREDLITNTHRLYGAFPCTKCGQTVQYTAKQDGWEVFATSKTDCNKGGKHEV
jgi:hypothetical protein